MEKLKDYQVVDVMCGGTFYKVRHKVTNNIFAWKAYDCSAYSHKQIQNVVNDVKIITKVLSEYLLRYYDTILHAPTKTLYFVLEHNSWRCAEELIAVCKATDKYFAESFIWYLLLVLARVCKLVEDLNFIVLRKCITASSIFVNESCEVRVNCFELTTVRSTNVDLMRQVGDVLHALCYQPGACDDKIEEFYYSDDLRDVISFLADSKNINLRPDVILYHPTVLANLETLVRPDNLGKILVSVDYSHLTSEVNKCDSEKAVELCNGVNSSPRTHNNVVGSPIYCNVSPKQNLSREIVQSYSARGSLSPTLAALALELPGFVPRTRRPITDSLESYNNPQLLSETTLSQQWMSRLIALRQREQSLNKRERDLIAKEIIHSPNVKIVPLNDSRDELECNGESNGITLPPLINQVPKDGWVSRRRHRKSSSIRTKGRRKSYGYEDLDSSLSADTGDGSIIVTAKKFTKENMPRCSIFPDTKKVHFTTPNPFIDSDDSVTLTFYDLENVSKCEVPNQEEKVQKDITKFKYLDLEKVTSEKRVAAGWSQSSPSKQAKITDNHVFTDITNMGRTPSKTSLMSKGSNSSRYSMISTKSCWSMESSQSKVSGSNVSDRTRSSSRQSRQSIAVVPSPPTDIKKSKVRKSLLPFKTPFKFRTSTKV